MARRAWRAASAVGFARLAAAVVFLSAGGSGCSGEAPTGAAGGDPNPPADTSPPASWVGAWAASPQPLGDPPLPLADVTLRQIVHLTADGAALRVRLDNTFGDQPVTFAGVRVAVRDAGGAIRADTDRAVTFGGQPAVTVAPGAQALGDPVELAVAAEVDLAVSMYLPGAAQATGHASAMQTSYLATGDHAADVSGAAYHVVIPSWYWLAGVDVARSSARGAVVALGDSITDGAGSTADANGRWPDVLSRRLLAAPAAARRSVLNAGIGGAKLLLDRGDCCGRSVAGLARLGRDVLLQTGVTHVLVLLGTNDLIDNGDPDAFIAGYAQLAAQVHARGLVLVGATIPPWGGFDPTPQHEVARQKVNAWLRASGDLDGLVDFDAVLRDPASPSLLLPAYDSGDHLHPGPAGHQAMGEAVDLALMR